MPRTWFTYSLNDEKLIEGVDEEAEDTPRRRRGVQLVVVNELWGFDPPQPMQGNGDRGGD